MSHIDLGPSYLRTSFEQDIFDRSLKNYKNKHGDHPGGADWEPGKSDIFYRSEIHKTDMWDEFWEKYINSDEELL